MWSTIRSSSFVGCLNRWSLGEGRRGCGAGFVDPMVVAVVDGVVLGVVDSAVWGVVEGVVDGVVLLR